MFDWEMGNPFCQHCAQLLGEIFGWMGIMGIVKEVERAQR